jgi:hypothetical protein
MEAAMEVISVLMLHQDADWPRWASLQQDNGHSAVVLLRQNDEPAAAFNERAQRKLAELKQAYLVAQVLDLSHLTRGRA